jgi:selenocysteine-specific elongation factor
MFSRGILIEEGVAVRLPSHQIQLSTEQQRMVDAFINCLAKNPYSPPSAPYLPPELVDLLIEQRRIVKVSDEIIFTASAYDEMIQRISSHLKSSGKITVAEVRNLLGTSRKYAVALMEYLDEQKTTRRVGDQRVLR